MKVLIVEDDKSCSTILTSTLEGDHHCDLAIDGREGFELFIKALDRDEPYDLVCLDLVLPQLDGQELLTMIRRHEEKRGMSPVEGTKIVIITSQQDTHNVLKAFREGCEAYVTKPLDLRKLREKLEKFGLLA